MKATVYIESPVPVTPAEIEHAVWISIRKSIRPRVTLPLHIPPCPPVGVQIRRLRLAAGLTQEAVAVAIDVSTNTVSRWETHTYQPSPRDLWALSKLFNVSIANLFGGLDPSLFAVTKEHAKDRVLLALNALTASLGLPRVTFESREQDATPPLGHNRHSRRTS